MVQANHILAMKGILQLSSQLTRRQNPDSSRSGIGINNWKQEDAGAYDGFA
jgi:hypothetical protein